MSVSKQKNGALVALAMAVLMTTVPLSAKPSKAGKGMPEYDMATEMTVRGEVTEIVEMDSHRGWKGIHLMVKAEDGSYEVHIGPKWFLEDKAVSFAAGDQIVVLGSKWQRADAGTAQLTSRQITRGDETLIVRDEKGTPVWRAGKGLRSGKRAGTH